MHDFYTMNGGRKFVIILLCILSANVGLYFKLITEVYYVPLILGLVGMYITGNVKQKSIVGDLNSSVLQKDN